MRTLNTTAKPMLFLETYCILHNWGMVINGVQAGNTGITLFAFQGSQKHGLNIVINDDKDESENMQSVERIIREFGDLLQKNQMLRAYGENLFNLDRI